MIDIMPWIYERIRAEQDRLELDLVMAIRLQDYDKLDRLIIVREFGEVGYAASWLGPVYPD